MTWSIYTYFMAALMGAQWVRPEHPDDFETTYKLPSFASASINRTNPDGTLTQPDGNSHDYQALDLYFPFFLTLQVRFLERTWVSLVMLFA